MLTGCNKSPAPSSPDSDMAVAKVDPGTPLSKVYNIDRIVELEPIKIRIVNIGIVNFLNAPQDRSGQVALGLEIANTGDQTVYYYPEEMVLTTPSGQNFPPDVTISSDVGGSYPPRTIKKGFILFPVAGNMQEEISRLTIKFPAPEDSHHNPLREELTIDIELKEQK
ncbi:hypothetical protein [Thermanaeromonas sp. C210]|uniref:hypothetical protein n=1 Tax=Thermanaeromonas sp. C210 TaxID=2731925 RepID=UPI00156341F1|nr:hypothetical protein [Thermanaeromonas sp. C210]